MGIKDANALPQTSLTFIPTEVVCCAVSYSCEWLIEGQRTNPEISAKSVPIKRHLSLTKCWYLPKAKIHLFSQHRRCLCIAVLKHWPWDTEWLSQPGSRKQANHTGLAPPSTSLQKTGVCVFIIAWENKRDWPGILRNFWEIERRDQIKGEIKLESSRTTAQKGGKCLWYKSNSRSSPSAEAKARRKTGPWKWSLEIQLGNYIHPKAILTPVRQWV